LGLVKESVSRNRGRGKSGPMPFLLNLFADLISSPKGVTHNNNAKSARYADHELPSLCDQSTANNKQNNSHHNSFVKKTFPHSLDKFLKKRPKESGYQRWVRVRHGENCTPRPLAKYTITLVFTLFSYTYQQ
jgi:hypothetical protein